MVATVQILTHKNRATIHHIPPPHLNLISVSNLNKYFIKWNICASVLYYNGTTSILIHPHPYIHLFLVKEYDRHRYP